MNKIVTIQEIVSQTAELQELFRRVENRPWTIETFVIELLAEVGTLADSIMIKEKYRNIREGQDGIDLEDDISDVLFVLLMIANHYKIDVEQAYISMINSTLEKLKR